MKKETHRSWRLGRRKIDCRRQPEGRDEWERASQIEEIMNILTITYITPVQMNELVKSRETESKIFLIKNALPLGVIPAEAGIQDNMEFNFVFDAINPSYNFLKYLNINCDYFESKISSYGGLDSRLRGNDAGAWDAAPFDSEIFPLR